MNCKGFAGFECENPATHGPKNAKQATVCQRHASLNYRHFACGKLVNVRSINVLRSAICRCRF